MPINNPSSAHLACSNKNPAPAAVCARALQAGGNFDANPKLRDQYQCVRRLHRGAPGSRDDVKMLKNIQGVRRKSSMLYLAVPATHFRGLLDAIPESLPIDIISE